MSTVLGNRNVLWLDLISGSAEKVPFNDKGDGRSRGRRHHNTQAEAGSQ